MPEDHSEEDRERKKRVNKLKARTSKMRLAAADSIQAYKDPLRILKSDKPEVVKKKKLQQQKDKQNELAETKKNLY